MRFLLPLLPLLLSLALQFMSAPKYKIQIKISSVQYEMLVALGKRWRIKPKDLIAEFT
jgi:hypothetical protein